MKYSPTLFLGHSSELAARRVAPISARSSTSPVSEMEPGTRFLQSFVAAVEAWPGKCQSKRHFRGCVREVVGYLDSLAARDPERFAWPSPSNIVEHCNKFSQGKSPYKLRMVMYALAYLRKLRVIEKVKRFRRGAQRDGFIVAPHDCFTERQGTACVWVGYSGERAAAVQATVHRAVHDAVHKETPNCARRCAHNNDKIDLQPAAPSATCQEPGGANRVSLVQSALGTLKPETPVLEESEEIPKTENPKNQKQVGQAVVEKQRLIEQTIGQHFGGEPYSMTSLASVSDGVLVTDTSQWDFETERRMQECCGQVIREFASLPYVRERTARNSHALVMNAAGKRFNKAHGMYPSSWLRVLNELRGSSTAEKS